MTDCSRSTGDGRLAKEQARLLQAGRLSELDIEHVVEEIEDVGKGEQRERRGRSWRVTIQTQRNSIAWGHP